MQQLTAQSKRNPRATRAPDGFDVVDAPSGLHYPVKRDDEGKPLFFVRKYDKAVMRFERPVKAVTLIDLWLMGYREYREKFELLRPEEVERGQLIGVPVA